MSNEKQHPIMKAGSGIVGLCLLLIILIAANVIIRNANVRHDFTEEQLYTLSDGTRSYLRKLQDPVTLKFFFSRSSREAGAQLKSYAKQVADLLEEYQIASDGKVIVETYDPKLDSDEEDLARRYGIAPQQRTPFGAPLYFGLAATFGDTEAALPAFDPAAEYMLEYNITRLIHRVTHPEKPVLGVLSSLPILGSDVPAMPGMPPQNGEAPWMAMQDLQKDYELRKLETSITSIPDGIDALMVVHPKDFPDSLLFAIDQFVVGGGQLLALVDPFCIADLQNAPPQRFGTANAASDLEKLFSAWGIGYDKGKIVADLKAVTSLSAGGGQREESPVFLTLRPEAGNIEPNDLLTAQLNILMVPFGGAITDETGDEITFTPLVSASDIAGLVPAFQVQMGPQAIRRNLKPAETQPCIAARLTGTFKTAFPDGPPADEADAEDAPTEDNAAADEAVDVIQQGQSSVIVFADVDMIVDQFAAEEVNIFGYRGFRPLNDNVNLFGNAIEQVAGSVDLIGIRSRGSFARPFTKVQELEATAREKWQQRENELMGRLEETRRKLSELQRQKDETERFIMSAAQQKELERFREEEAAINTELREVQKQLRRDIDRLGVKVKLANIALMPALVALAGILYGLMRKRAA